MKMLESGWGWESDLIAAAAIVYNQKCLLEFTVLKPHQIFEFRIDT
jgi:hypothetical protein